MSEAQAAGGRQIRDLRHLHDVDLTGELSAIAAAMAAGDGVGEVAKALLDRGIGATGAAAGVVATRTGDGTELALVASSGYEEEELGRWERVSLDVPLPITQAVCQRRVVVVATAEELAERYPNMAALARTPQALAAFPIVDGNRVLGAVALRFDTDQAIALPGSDGERPDVAIAKAVVPALLERVSQLTGALQSRIVIEQAKGVLAERHGVTPAEAFVRLRAHARSHSRSIHAVAADVVSGALRL